MRIPRLPQHLHTFENRLYSNGVKGHLMDRSLGLNLRYNRGQTRKSLAQANNPADKDDI